jgi:hypothetical protein
MQLHQLVVGTYEEDRCAHNSDHAFPTEPVRNKVRSPGPVLSRHQPDPRRKIASGPKHCRVRYRRGDRGRPDDANAGDGFNPLACLVRAMLHLDPLFDRSDHRLRGLKLRRQYDDARPCIDRQARVLFVRHEREQFFHPFITLCSHDAELGQMRTQCIDHLGTLTHEQIARAMLH